MRLAATSMSVLLAAVPFATLAASKQDELCAPLRSFALSVPDGRTESVEFRTSGLSPFKDMDQSGMGAFKRCDVHGSAAGKVLCAYLMGTQNTDVEFAGNNVKRALLCLSPGTRFGPHYLLLESAEFHLSYGTQHRGSNVTLTFGADIKIGGTVFIITAEGY